MEPNPHPKKRIVVCFDGTWMDSDGHVQIPSNVTRLARSIRPIGEDSSASTPTSIPQVVFYQNGVGTGSKSLYTKYVGGATGEGIAHNIREAYSFICHNYHADDEIFLIGFSRGAFTARSVSSLIRTIGLLTPAGLKYLTPIFEDWKHQCNKSWKSNFDTPWPNRPAVNTDEYRRKLLDLELTRPNIQIKCVAVWDTVGALGIPRLAILPQAPSTDYAFVNTRVEPNIEYAYQALALDERRRSYRPTIWEKPTGQVLPRVLKQTWFPGSHSDVGGSYEDADLANLTLAWMVTQLEPLLTIDHELITREIRLAKEAHDAKHEPVREWGLGKIHKSMSPFFRILGSQSRTPKEYCEIDRTTRQGTGRRLENTCETIHSSVRIRMGRDGLGYDDKGRYDSSALQGWTFCGETTDPTALGLPGPVGKMSNVMWRKKINTKTHDGEVVSEEVLQMPEDTLQGFERRLLNLWPELALVFDQTRPGRHPTELVFVKALTYPAPRKDAPKLATILPERVRTLSRSRHSQSRNSSAGRGDSSRDSSLRRGSLTGDARRHSLASLALAERPNKRDSVLTMGSLTTLETDNEEEHEMVAVEQYFVPLPTKLDLDLVKIHKPVHRQTFA